MVLQLLTVLATKMFTHRLNFLLAFMPLTFRNSSLISDHLHSWFLTPSNVLLSRRHKPKVQKNLKSQYKLI